MIPRIREGMQIRPEEWGATVIDRWFEKIFELDQAGFDILQEVDGCSTLHDITCRLAEKWDADADEILETVTSFLAELENNGVIYDPDNPEKLGIMKKLRASDRRFGGFEETPEGPQLMTDDIGLFYDYKRLNAPLYVTFDITARCNLRCRYCYVNAGHELPQELTTDQIKSIIDELLEIGLYRISLSGGEPTVRDDFCDLVKYCVDKNLSINITTNGTLITPALASELHKTGLKRVQISIDSVDPSLHDYMRGEGTHKRTLQGLKYLKDVGFKYINISCVPTKVNLKDIPNLIDWTYEQGLPTIRLLRFMPAGKGQDIKSVALDHEEVQYLLSIADEKKKEYKNRLIIEITDAFRAVLAEKPSYTCNAAKTWCAIDSQGYVFPCTLMINPDAVATLHPDNILEKGFQNIWLNNPLMEKMRNPILLEGKCANCKELHLCQGGCRAYTLAETGSLHAPDPICGL